MGWRVGGRVGGRVEGRWAGGWSEGWREGGRDCGGNGGGKGGQEDGGRSCRECGGSVVGGILRAWWEGGKKGRREGAGAEVATGGVMAAGRDLGLGDDDSVPLAVCHAGWPCTDLAAGCRFCARPGSPALNPFIHQLVLLRVALGELSRVSARCAAQRGIGREGAVEGRVGDVALRRHGHPALQPATVVGGGERRMSHYPVSGVLNETSTQRPHVR